MLPTVSAYLPVRSGQSRRRTTTRLRLREFINACRIRQEEIWSLSFRARCRCTRKILSCPSILTATAGSRVPIHRIIGVFIFFFHRILHFALHWCWPIEHKAFRASCSCIKQYRRDSTFLTVGRLTRPLPLTVAPHLQIFLHPAEHLLVLFVHACT